MGTWFPTWADFDEDGDPDLFLPVYADGDSNRLYRNTSWRSANGPALHFGLGDGSTVDHIEVRWPSGRIDTLPGPIEVNQRITITEG